MSASRRVSAIGGGFAFLLVTVVTFGLALLAPLGMWVAGRIMRRQQQPLTRFTSWLGAVYGVGLVIMLAFGVTMFNAVSQMRDPKFQRTMDSVRAAQRSKPPPAWLERVAPGSTARTQSSQPTPGGTAEKAMGVAGSVIGAVLLGTLGGMQIGSLAWWACLPLYFAIHGYRLGEQPPAV